MELFGFDIGGVGGQLQSVLTAILLIVVVFAVGIVGFYLVRNYLRYKQFICIIWEKDALGNTIEKLDKAGVFLDKKSGNKLFRSKKYKMKLDPDSVFYNYKGNKKIAYFFQKGLNVFLPVKLDISANPGVTYTLGEVDINWGLDEFNKYAKVYQTQNWLQQYLPYIMIAVSGMIIVIMVYIVLQKFDVVASAAESLKEAAKSIAQANSGTTILESAG